MTEIFSGAALLGALGFSLRWNWWRPAKKGIPVLMYHKIGDPPRGSQQKSLWVSTVQFEWQMKILRDKGYQSVTFYDVRENKLPSKPVLITFDDGYLNQKMNAAPILERYGMKGIFYAVANAIGRDNFWHDPAKEARQPMMTAEDLKELRRLGHEIGSHAMTHSRMDALPFETARQELVESKKRLGELLGVEVVSFAFPYGKGEDAPELVEAARQAGYGWILGIHSGIWDTKDGARPLPRIFVRGDDAKLDFYLQLSRGRSRV